MIDYFSVSYETESAAQAVASSLTALAMDGPFQIPGHSFWYFNVRSEIELDGDWISTTPETPFRIWA